MNTQLMQFESITQEQWNEFLRFYAKTMGMKYEKFTSVELTEFKNDLEQLVKERGVSCANSYMFEWESELINSSYKNGVILGTCSTKYNCVFILS